MPQRPYVLVDASLRRVDAPDSDRHLIITSIAMPAITLVKASHTPGGGVASVGFLMPRIEELEPTFNAAGPDLDAFVRLGVVDRYVITGVYRLKSGGRIVPARGIIEGAIQSWSPAETSATEVQSHAYGFAEVTHYEFYLDDEEKFYFDFEENEIRRAGQSLTADINRAAGRLR